MTDEITKVDNEESTSKKMVIVDGVKMELDMRTAKLAQIDVFKIGDPVKIMITKYSTPECYTGAIVGFDNFKDNPTILVAYLDSSNANIKIVAFNKETKEVSICRANDADIPFAKSDILEELDRKISSKEQELRDAKQAKEYFLKYFGKCFKLSQEDEA